MNYILLNILVGFLLVPILLFVAVPILGNYREKRGMVPISPNQLSLLIILCSLVSWFIAGFNILLFLLRK